MSKNYFLSKWVPILGLISFFVVISCTNNNKNENTEQSNDSSSELKVVSMDEATQTSLPEVSIDKGTLTQIFNVLNVSYVNDEELKTLSKDVKVMYFTDLGGDLSKVDSKTEASIVIYSYKNMHVEEIMTNVGDSQVAGLISFNTDLSKVLNLVLINAGDLSNSESLFRDAEIKGGKVVIRLEATKDKDLSTLIDAVNLAISNLRKVMPLMN